MIKGIVGIECGSRNSVISKIGRHGLENIQSESSNREIPCIIVFGSDQRLFAEIAQDRLKAFWQQAIVYPFRLCATDEIKRGFSFFNHNPSTNRAIIDGQELELVQLVASYFTYLDSLIYKNLSEQDNYACAISAPNYFTIQEKLRLQTSFQIARLPCLKIVEEHCAIGYSYLWFQKKELNEKRRRVLFIDLGQSQTSCFIYDFDKLTARAEYVNSNRDLGVRNIDALVYQYLKVKNPEVFQNLNKKADIRIIEQIEKLRKILSSNIEANFLIECLTSEHDLQHNFSREEFENILIQGGFITSLEEMLNRSVSYCLQHELLVDDIEIIGGGTRIPIVQAMIKKFFNREKLGISMQTSENISRGCAIACALAASQINPLIKIENYKLYNILQHDLNVELFVQGQLVAEQKFISTQFLPTFQQISAVLPEYVENMTIELKYNNTTYKNTEKVSGNNINIAYTICDNGFIQIKQASVVAVAEKQNNLKQQQDMVDEAQEQAEQSNQMETEVNEKYFDLDIEDLEYGDEVYKAMIQKETSYRERDNKVLMKLEKRNFLEMYVNESHRFVEEQLKFHLSQDRLAGVILKLQENKDFIENNFDVDLEEIESRIQSLKAVYEPIKDEYFNKESQKLPIRNLEELKNIATAYNGRNIQDIQLLLSNQSIGDGGGILGFFKSAGSIRMKEYLSQFSISGSVLLELGNNNFSDVGIKNILKGISSKSILLKEVSINIESILKLSNANAITNKSIQRIIKFVSKLQHLEILEIVLNYIEQNDLTMLEQVLLQKNKLKQVKISIKNFQENQIDREKFILQVQRVCNSVLVDCYNQTGMKVY